MLTTHQPYEVANGRQESHDLSELKTWLESLRDQKEGRVVFRLSLSQHWDSVGHTWNIITNEDGSGGYWLQSYIQQYNLNEYLNERGAHA